MPFGSEGREHGTGLALSGGGFRAVLFHIGALSRLNEVGLLSKMSRISSVSGGSIVAGALAVKWDRLIVENNVVRNLDDEVLMPLRRFCSRTIDVWSVISGALNPFKTAGEEVADEYREHLGMSRKLVDLPTAGPRFVFNSTNYATGSSFRFSAPYCGDYRIGLIRNPPFDVALAVACSSAFPPVLAPIEIDVDADSFERTDGADLYDRESFRKRLNLADGGVYDNLGLESVWDRYDTVLVSDAGKPFELDAGISTLAPKQIFRVMDIGLNQALALRKRMLIYQLQSQAASGAYWGISTPIARYPSPSPIPVSVSKTAELSAIRTRLNKFNEQEKCELINWGYAVSDAALRSHMGISAPPATIPYPGFPLG